MTGSDYSRIEQALKFLEAQARQQPSLAALAGHLGLSEFHCQRLFRRWAGISPKDFLQCLTLQRAKELLAESRSLLETSLEVGLSSSSRLHDLFLGLEAMTPGEFKRQGVGLTLRWGVHPTPFGAALFAATDRGLCALSFLETAAPGKDLGELQARWPGAILAEEPRYTQSFAQAVVGRMKGEQTAPLPLVLKGSSFQLQVWKALLRIPEGALVTYGDLASLAETPKASRAVGSALAMNPIGYLIPCHRVIRATGALGEYHWGSPRKRALVGMEGARCAARERVS
jgi:AraC family transcriptional regulator, regulatory protein of adaptative response / methylated-DNA-[protein]-cysteine methyltransferase